jgi:hypothetical protein
MGTRLGDAVPAGHRRGADQPPAAPELAGRQAEAIPAAPFAPRQLRHSVVTHLANVAGWTPLEVAGHLGDTLEVALSHYIEPPSEMIGTAERARMPGTCDQF